MALRTVRYLRVSRSDQDPQLQDDETKEFITRRGWHLVDTFDAVVVGGELLHGGLHRLPRVGVAHLVYSADRSDPDVPEDAPSQGTK
jgi:hypothetical protein